MANVSKENYIGCLLGGAVGDALGAPVEFLNLARIRLKYGPKGISDYVEFGDHTGEFTDDTQMTLITAEALLRACHRAMIKSIGGALNIIAHQSYLRWLHMQNIGINSSKPLYDIDVEKGWLIQQKALFKKRAPGNTCIIALSSGIAGTIDQPINNSKGCGTIMRMAPVGLMFDGEAEKSFQIGCELAALTHGHPTGILSAGFFAALISCLASGITLNKAIVNSTVILKKHSHHQETLQAVEAAIDLHKRTRAGKLATEPETIEKLGQGWIAEETLSISIFASLLFEKDFEKGVLFSVNHSGDSDSTGSITGNILGLINGLESLPKKWIDNLRHHEIVGQIGEDLHQKVKGNTYDMDDGWWEKYPGF
ncbi:MAG: ADP-ribosylglycohydrolase family protein [Prolixibacteraceae bacterium]|jgi:ADP-ribosylglycohydrolase|nr:ADP-ribosylglycohydrolase family protein [Prolixibacteraceae bacterium]